MDETEITFDKLPEAVAYLISEISRIRKLLEETQRTIPAQRTPVSIDDASKLILKAKSTIYSLVRRGEIPCYKSGRKLYFYEDELLDWIAKGKKKSVAETKEEIEAQMLRTVRHKPSVRSF